MAEKIEDKKPETKKIADKKTVAEKIEDKKPATKKIADKKVVAEKIEDKKPAAKKIADKKPETKRSRIRSLWRRRSPIKRMRQKNKGLEV